MDNRSNARIRVTNLVKRYRRRGSGGEVIPVNQVSLEVDTNEMVVLLGPSGCGKTTLLRCIAGLERPDSGEIVIDDEIVFSSAKKIFMPANRRRASMIFQSYALWPHMTVFENVIYPLLAQKVERREAARRAKTAIATVGLEGLADSFPANISGGQQQRVALARAIVRNSKVILFDEPLSNVDAKVREQLRLEIGEMQRRLGFTGLYVTHDQSEAMAVSNRIAVLRDGRICQLDKPDVIYDLPVSHYVGTFIGAANTWPGTVTHISPERIKVDTPVGQVVVASPAKGSWITAGSRVSVLFRPENAVLEQSTPATDNRWPVVLQAREFFGAHSEYVVDCAGTPVRVWLNKRGLGEAGSQLWLGVDPASLRLLPAEEQ